MAFTARSQAIYWSVAAAVFVLLLWTLGDVLLPFVLGMVIAYLLDPVADRLQRVGLSRAGAVAVIAVGAVLLFVGAIVPAILTLDDQIRTLVARAPDLVEAAIDPDGPLATRFPFVAEYRDRIAEFAERALPALRARTGDIVSGLLTAGRGLLGVALLLVIAPVVAVYMLLDWNSMVARLDELLPREHAPTIRRLARQVDDTLAGFLRGQGTVMLILGTFYAVALGAAGLNFGIVIGALAGLLTFIPYVGAIIGGGLSIGVALVQFWGEWGMIAAVAAIFVFGQFAEGNFLTPKLVGDSVGVHPVWLLLALAAFGALFGFIGLLVAVPVAAVIGVIARFAVQQYTASNLYLGAMPADPDHGPPAVLPAPPEGPPGPGPADPPVDPSVGGRAP